MYAILIVGYGKKARYTVRYVVDGTSWPISRPFRTLQAAQAEADLMGVTIEKIGDIYETL